MKYQCKYQTKPTMGHAFYTGIIEVYSNISDIAAISERAKRELSRKSLLPISSIQILSVTLIQ